MIDVSITKRTKSADASGVIQSTGFSSVTKTESSTPQQSEYAAEAAKAKEAEHAISADHATSAAVLDDDSATRQDFLSRKADDSAAGVITLLKGLLLGDGTHGIDKDGNITSSSIHNDGEFEFGGDIKEKNATEGASEFDGKGFIYNQAKKQLEIDSLIVRMKAVFKDGATFGTFIKSLYAGTGAGIDALGNAEFESVRVRSYFEAMEYIVNRLSAIEGDQLLTEGDTIDSIVDNGDGTYGLYLHSKWDGYFTAQKEGNVLKGIVNTLASGSGTYYTSWMRVNSVNPALNYIEVSLYPDADTPAGKNYPPVELMKFARWGNQSDTTRQSCFYLSSTEGRIVHLTGVTKPIIDKSNYGATFGSTPEFLKEMGLPLVDGQDYVYARGLIVQDIIRIDYQGKPIVTYVDRGEWNAAANYYSEAVNPGTGQYETSDVWYNGCKYRCMKNLTKTAPAWNNTDWAMVEGNPAFTVDFADTDYIFDPDRFSLTLTIIARLYNMDITDDILPADVEWTRYSEDANGVPRTASDNAWALKRAGAGKSLSLTIEDCDLNGYMPRTLKFIATVTLRDGMGNEAGTESAIFQY